MKIKKWETALAVGLLMALLICVMPISAQAQLSEKLIRLHILANSDEPEDQELKIKVRDAVLESITQEDDEITEKLLLKMQRVAQDTVYDEGYDYPVTVEKKNMYFDTRVYDGFALPAGRYDAVRILIGEGSGHNWWCVLFPPLCAGVAEADLESVAKNAGLTDDEISYICEDGTAYVIRFKIAELWGKFTSVFE